jgi:predicted amidophosphoribosyltransferase
VKYLSRRLEIAKVLKRRKATQSQPGLTREERIVKMRDAFRIVAPARVKGATRFVVDDVMTTGTTPFRVRSRLRKLGRKEFGRNGSAHLEGCDATYDC